MGKIWSIILAAGESKRMKVPKMLLPYEDKTIIEKVIENVISSGIKNVKVVLGSWSDDILKVTCNMSVTNCYNEDFMKGMLSSVKCGFGNLDDKCKAALLFLGDQPGIKPDVIKNLIEAYRKSGKGIIMPMFNNKRGHPLIIDCKYRDEIAGLDQSGTLRDLVHKHPDDVLEIEVRSESVLKDIDTQEDYLNELKQIK